MFSHIKGIHPQTIMKAPSLQAELKFKPGEILNGMVVKKFGQGDFLVSARGSQFRGHTALNLMEGGKYIFQVNSSISGIELKVLDGMVQKAGLPMVVKSWAASRGVRNKLVDILTRLGDAQNTDGLSKETGQFLKNLTRLFPSIIYSDPGKGNEIWLARALLRSGQFWENRVFRYLLGGRSGQVNTLLTSDLKGMLLSLKKGLLMENQESRQVKSLLSQVSQGLGLIEQDQLLNLSSLEEDLGWFWFIPGNVDDGFEKAELFVRKQQEEGFYFSILLEFTHLGQMEADISMVKTIINVKIRLQDAERADFVTKNLYLLEKGLQDAGFKTGSLACEVKEVDLDGEPFSMSDISFQSVHIVI